MGVQLLRRSRSKEGSTVSPERRQPFCLIGIKAAFRSGTSSRGEARCASSWYQVIRISIKVWMLLSSAWEIIWSFTRIKHVVHVEVFCAPNCPLTSLQLLWIIYFVPSPIWSLKRARLYILSTGQSQDTMNQLSVKGRFDYPTQEHSSPTPLFGKCDGLSSLQWTFWSIMYHRRPTAAISRSTHALVGARTKNGALPSEVSTKVSRQKIYIFWCSAMTEVGEVYQTFGSAESVAPSSIPQLYI